MIDYLGLLITFLATIIAIKGGTWDNNRKGIQKLTITGRIAVIIAFLGFIISIITTHQTKKESKLKLKKLIKTLSYTEQIKIKVKNLEKQLENATKREREIKEQLEIYKDILQSIRGESERQPQVVMAQYVELGPYELYLAPNLLYGGSIIKFYGFRSKLLLVYGNRFLNPSIVRRLASEVRRRLSYEEISESNSFLFGNFNEGLHYHIIIPSIIGHSEIAVIGGSGIGMHWVLVNLSDRYCGGKVFVESTPRIRSHNWSWVEETISSINSIPLQSKVEINVNLLNLRKCPDTSCQIIGKLKYGEIYTVLEKKGLWLYISKNSIKGWVFGRYVKLINH